jgi:hypothetical protein
MLGKMLILGRLIYTVKDLHKIRELVYKHKMHVINFLMPSYFVIK